MERKGIMKTIRFLAFATCLLPLAAVAGSRDSRHYSVPADTVDAGGRRTTTAAYTIDASIGGIGGLSTVGSPSETARHGYPGQLFAPTGLAVSANPTNINENSTRQLAAQVSYDDGTVSPLAAAVDWSVISGPLRGVSPSGLVTATNVFQDTPATVGGTSGEFSGVLGLLVLNTGIDDFAFYAGDGIDDAWQVQYFGENNVLAFPGADPDGDGQTNYYEYVATSIPTNAASKFRMSIANVPGRPEHKAIRVSPFSFERTYIMQARPVADSGLFVPLDGDVSLSGDEVTFTDTNALGTAKFYRVLFGIGGP